MLDKQVLHTLDIRTLIAEHEHRVFRLANCLFRLSQRRAEVETQGTVLS